MPIASMGLVPRLRSQSLLPSKNYPILVKPIHDGWLFFCPTIINKSIALPSGAENPKASAFYRGDRLQARISTYTKHR